MLKPVFRRIRATVIGCAAATILLLASVWPTAAAEPIKIGFGMALTGGLAGNGKAALIAIQIWAEEVNAKGGLLGRPVQLVYYDDQTNPATVPGIYTKLLDVDKVDLVDLRLRHQSAGAGHADRHAARHGLRRPVRPRRQRPVPLRPLLPDAAERARRQARLRRKASSKRR